MTTTTSESSKQTGKSNSDINAIDLLKEDHRKVEDLFEEFENAKRKDRKEKLALQICEELSVHAEIEEKVFYPQAEEVLGTDADLVDEAKVEHQSLKWLIEQIKSDSPEGDLYEARVKVLKEYVEHHVKEEEKELFPKVKKTELDLSEVGKELASMKKTLLASKH